MENNAHCSEGCSVVLFGRRIRLLDIAAIFLFLFLFGWFFVTVRLGVNASEESFYITLGDRFLRGDRPLIDEWHVTQFTGFLYVIPLWIHRLLSGGNEGVVLFIRYLCVVMCAGVYWFFYAHFRKYGWAALVGIFAYFLFLSVQGFALYYYNVATNGSVIVCTVLFLSDRRPSPFLMLFTGIVFAFSVLTEPLFALLYLTCCLIVLYGAANKKWGFRERFPAFAPINWLWLTAGAVICAVPVVSLLLINGVSNIAAVSSMFFGDSEYQLFSSHVQNMLWKLMLLFRYYGWLNAVAWGLLTAAAAALRIYRKKHLRAVLFAAGKKRKRSIEETAVQKRIAAAARVMFLLAVCLLATTYLWGLRSFAVSLRSAEDAKIYMYHFYHTAAFSVFFLVCRLLSEKTCVPLFAFWVTALVEGMIVLYSSNVVCSLFGIVAYPAGMIFANDVRRELFPRAAATLNKRWIVVPLLKIVRLLC